MRFLLLLPLTSLLLAAQMPMPNPGEPPAPPVPATFGAPLPESGLVRSTAQAINYQMLTSSTKISFQGTSLLPAASGMAKVKAKRGTTTIKAKFEHLPEPSSFGVGSLTYVLWAVSPQGRTDNLGELRPHKGACKLKVTEQQPIFALLVTAEPHFAVTRPSTAVLLENAPGPETVGKIEQVQASFELVRRESYAAILGTVPALPADAKAPEEIQQARMAVALARAAGAPGYAAEPYTKAEGYLHQSEQDGDSAPIRALAARAAVQSAEDARGLAEKARRVEQLEVERRMAQDKLDRANAETARAALAQQAAVLQASKVEAENEGLRDKLMSQLSGILQTRATARGLIVSMSGVLFKSGQATLTAEAREKLAKVAGILSVHKGIQIEADGFTDSVGPEPFNLKLSASRAQNARDFLVSQGVKPEIIIFRGFGEDRPIASNDTETGRQENRRVELVVSGEGITGGKAVAP
jgi:outer membrane protein OmpA-like peptidoglycan-associated protein